MVLSVRSKQTGERAARRIAGPSLQPAGPVPALLSALRVVESLASLHVPAADAVVRMLHFNAASAALKSAAAAADEDVYKVLILDRVTKVVWKEDIGKCKGTRGSEGHRPSKFRGPSQAARAGEWAGTHADLAAPC